MCHSTDKEPEGDEEEKQCEACNGDGSVEREGAPGCFDWCDCPVGDSMRRLRRDQATANRRLTRQRHVVAVQPNNPWRKAILDVLDRALEHDLVVSVYTRGAQFTRQFVTDVSPVYGIVRLASVCGHPDGSHSHGEHHTILPLTSIEAITVEEKGVDNAK